MDYVAIVIAISGTAVGSIGTLLVQYFINKQQYKLDYYRYIIDKRFKAYEKVEILFKLIMTCYGGSMGMINKIVYDITNDPDSYNDVRKQYDSVFEMSMWINDKTGELLARFNDLMVCYKYYIEHSDIDNRYLYFEEYYNKYIGCTYMPIITEYTELFNERLDKNFIMKYISVEANSIAHQLEKSLANDYKSFKDVERFLNRYNK
ncbi:MAG: hypothetical protein ACLT1E_07155 [Veillonella nakazawae]|uniref:hypothetical protein n=1 Tax=Veillonella nakazawae TaxID=2682456 RepID=UPI0039944F5B